MINLFWFMLLAPKNKILVPSLKGDIQNYTNYRGVKFRNHTMKL